MARSHLVVFPSAQSRCASFHRSAKRDRALDIHADVQIYFCTTPLMLQMRLLNTGVLSIAVQHVYFCIIFCSWSL